MNKSYLKVIARLDKALLASRKGSNGAQRHQSQVPVLSLWETLSPTKLLQILESLYGGKAASTWNVAVSAVHKYSEELLAKGVRDTPLLPKDTKLKKVPKRLPKPVDEEEVSRLLSAVDDPQDMVLLEILVSSGLRASEAGSLRFGDIDSDGFVTVIGKGDKERRTFLTREAMVRLKRWTIEAHLGEKLPSDSISLDLKYWGWVLENPKKGIFTGADGRAVIDHANPADWVYGRVTKYTDASPHRFRHFWVTDLLNNGADIQAVMAAAGHESVSTTMGYKKVLSREITNLRSKHSREQGVL